MYFELWSTVEGPEGVLGFLQPVTAAALSRLLADTAPPGQAAAAAAEAEVPLAFFWKGGWVAGLGWAGRAGFLLPGGCRPEEI